MEIEDSDIFEITDYTNVSEWEKFISKLEEIITSLENSQINEDKEKNVNSVLKFNNHIINAMLFQPDILSCDNNQLLSDENNNIEAPQSLIIKYGKRFISEIENDVDCDVIKWFGKRRFIVLTPSNQTVIYGQEQIKHLVSSVMTAICNLKCQLPIIIKYGPRNWPLYEGVILDNDFKGKLQSAVIKYTPKQFDNLSGIRRIFQEKLGKGYILDDDVILSAKYLFIIENCPIKNEGYFQGQFTQPKRMHFFQFMAAGFTKDPIKSLRLFAHWPKVLKEVLSHTEYICLPVSSSSSWFLSCISENSYDGILYKILRKLLKSFLVAQTTSEILRDVKMSKGKNINQPLLKLTKSPITNHHLFKRIVVDQLNFSSGTTDSSIQGAPALLDEKVLQEILMFLFPDARHKCEEIQHSYDLKPQKKLPNYTKLKRKLPHSNNNFLIHRLSVCMANLLTHHKEGIKCFSYIWMEVVLELRYRLENIIPLSDTRMSDDFYLIEDDNCLNKDEIFVKLLQESMPYLGGCQLEQQLQLLNYCILTRLRNQYLSKYDPSFMTESSDSDEQFFDCEIETAEVTQEPRGRLRQYNSHCLINFPNVPLYVPITQVLPVTVLRESRNRESMDSLNVSHTVSLVADMSAFKAANPGCVIEDFIRWYSPNDFVDEDLTPVDDLDDPLSSSTNKGGLSFRMKVADNTWLKSWEMSSPLPARLQKRLFDETTAAENVLIWLHNLTIAEISSSLMNNVLVDSLDALVECIEDHDPPNILNEIDSAAAAVVRFLEATDVIDITGAELEYYQSYDQMITNLQRIEYFFAVKRSLYHKLIPEHSSSVDDKHDIMQVINSLMVSDSEVVISKKLFTTCSYEYIFNRLMSLYVFGNRRKESSEEMYDIDNIFCTADQKEYVLNLESSYPLATSRKTNQRLYVCSNEQEFRMASVIFEDMTYF